MTSAGKRARVIVVGGGLPGLCAARELEAQGVAVSLIERRDEMGGRYRSSAEPSLHGIVSMIPRRTPALDVVLRGRGMRDALHLLPLTDVSILLTERGGRTDLRPIDLRRTGHMGSVPGLSPRELLRARRARRLVEWFGSRLSPSEPERVGALDDRSVSEFCDLYLGKTLYRNVYAPLLESHFGCNPEETSRVLLLLLLGPDGGPGVQLALGLPSLTKRLAAGLDDGRCSTGAVAVRPDGSGVELETGETIPGDAVVVAVGARDAQKLMTELSPREELFLESTRHTKLDWLELPNDLGSASTVWVGRRSGGPLGAVVRIPGRTLLIARPDTEATTPEDLLEPARRLNLVDDEREADVRTSKIAPRFDVGRYQALARFRQDWDRSVFRRRVVLCGDYLVGPHAEAEIASGLRAARETLEVLRGSPSGFPFSADASRR